MLPCWGRAGLHASLSLLASAQGRAGGTYRMLARYMGARQGTRELWKTRVKRGTLSHGQGWAGTGQAGGAVGLILIRGSEPV